MEQKSEQGLGYWIQWQVFVCALILISPAIAALFLIFRLKFPPLKTTDLWMPCWVKLHPLWLLFYRLIASSFMATLLYLMIAADGAFTFYFYTQWTFTLVVVYFVLGSIVSAHGCWLYSKEQQFIKGEERDGFLKTDSDERKPAATTFTKHETRGGIKLQSHYEEENAQRAGFWGYLMLVAFQTSAGAVMLTDIVFWCLIVPFLTDEHFSVNLMMGCVHTVNAAFLLLDTAVNSLRLPWFQLSYFVLWSCTYVIFQWVLHACGFSWWPYSFLELGTPWAPVWYICLALVHLPCYGIYYLIVKAKYSIFPKLFPNAFISTC